MDTRLFSAGLGLAFLTLVLAGPVAAEEEGRAWLGVQVRPMTETLAEETGYAGEGGVYLQSVVPGGPAADAGLRAAEELEVELGEIEEQMERIRQAMGELEEQLREIRREKR